MRVGVFTPLLSQLSLPAVLKKLKALQIDTVELGTGNYPGDAHCKLSMLENSSVLADFKKILADHGATISALSSHGTPPNWVTCPWPPEYLKLLEWQWNEVVAPYWVEQAKFAADHGVKVAIEMHPGFVVYNPESMLKLRSIAGPTIGCNFDPSHLFWQSIDPIAAVRVPADAIFHVHAKDTQIYSANLPRTGVLDTKSYTEERERSWIFRTCGYGHGAEWWSEFISTLRMFGYDSVLSIEHEDSLLSPEEGLTKAATFLNNIVIRERPGAAWWV